MDTTSTLRELQNLRNLLMEMDGRIEQLMQRIRDETRESAALPRRRNATSFETILPLDAGTSIFKGRIPVAVLFPDGRRVEAPTWKKVFLTVLKDCADIPACRAALMLLRDRVHGRSRLLLSSEAGALHSPVEITRGLYAEAHYDTESLLKILKTKLLMPAGYDFSGIRIAIRNDLSIA